MTTKYKVTIVITLMVVSAAVGRYTVPEKVRIETKTVEVIKEVKVEAKNENKKKDKTYARTTTTHPDGTSTTVTVIAEKDSDNIKDTGTTNTNTSIAKDETKEIIRGSSKTNLSLLAGVNVTNPGNGMLYGGHLSKEVLGPITIGVFGFTNGSAGCSIGINL